MKFSKLFSILSLSLISSAGFALAASDEAGESVTEVSSGGAAGGAIGGIIGLLVAVIMVVAMWKIFVKAGRPGWKSLIPIYNFYTLIKIAGKPGWWLLLCCIPFLNFIMIILIFAALSKSFGKSGGFTVGLILLSPIFIPILAFGDSKYVGAPSSLE